MTQEQFESAKEAFLPETWELAKALMYSLSLPFALIYHMGELDRAEAAFEEYRRDFEERVTPRIAQELEEAGFPNPKTAEYKRRFFERMHEAKDTDTTYSHLNRKVNEHQNGVQCACALFVTTLEAWRAHLGMGEIAFVAHCDRIVKALYRRVPLSLPEQFQPANFTALFDFMKKSQSKTKGG